MSSLLLGAWFGSLISGPIVDRLGRKRSIMVQNVVFLLGCSLQTGAQSEGSFWFTTREVKILTSVAYHFAGRVIGGISIGALTHIIPMYIAEVSVRVAVMIDNMLTAQLAPSPILGSIVALLQLAITLGVGHFSHQCTG